MARQLTTQRSFSFARMTFIAFFLANFFILFANARSVDIDVEEMTLTTLGEERMNVYARRQDSRVSASSVLSAEGAQATDNSEMQTVQTSQVFPGPNGNTTQVCTYTSKPITLEDGKEAVVISTICTSTFTPNANATSVSASGSTSASTFQTTIVTSTPIPTPSLTPTTPPDTSSSPPASTTTLDSSFNPSSSSSLSSPSITPEHANDTSDTSPAVLSPTLATPAPMIVTAGAATSTSTPTSFGSSESGHLSTLPIFLGAFGGIAGIALITVGCMVYHPIRRFNEWRLNPPAWLRPSKLNVWNQKQVMSEGLGGGIGDEKKFVDLESAMTSTSQDMDMETRTSAQMSRWSADSGGKMMRWTTSTTK